MKKRRYNLKAANQRTHAKRRAFERYGITLNKESYQTLILKLQRNHVVSIELPRRLTGRVTEWKILYEGRMMRLLYDRQRKTIITFLPLEPKEVDQTNSE